MCRESSPIARDRQAKLQTWKSSSSGFRWLPCWPWGGGGPCDSRILSTGGWRLTASDWQRRASASRTSRACWSAGPASAPARWPDEARGRPPTSPNDAQGSVAERYLRTRAPAEFRTQWACGPRLVRCRHQGPPSGASAAGARAREAAMLQRCRERFEADFKQLRDNLSRKGCLK